MTIAAGVQFNGGILLCADRQFSSPSIKFFDTKISTLENMAYEDREPVNSLVAMSGTDGYMQMAVAKCEDAISTWSGSDEPDATPVETVIAGALLDVFTKHLYPHPRYGYMDGPSVELLIGVWRGSGNAELYRTNETSVSRISFFEPCVFIGSGASIARYSTLPLIQPHFETVGMNKDEAVLLATHALNVAKNNDVYCGGSSDFAVLYDDGRISEVAAGEISANERYSATFEEIIRNLFFSLADLEGRLAPFSLELSKEQIASIKREQAQRKVEREKLADSLKPKKRSSNVKGKRRHSPS